MKKARFFGSLSAVVCCLFVVSDLGAQEIFTMAINFAADEPEAGGFPGVRSDVEGAAGLRGTNVWNNLDLNFGLQGDLIDANGNETGTSVIWESQNTWASAPVDGQGRAEINIDENVPLNDDRFLMTGYLDSTDFGEYCTPDQSNNPIFGGPNWCGANRVIVGGLPFEGPYDIIVYLNGGVAGRSGVYQLNNEDEVGHHDTGPFSGTYDVSVEERDLGDGVSLEVWTGDVIIFSDVVGDTFTINTHADDLGGTADGFRSLINGIEIFGELVVVPDPWPGDANDDGHTDAEDLNILALNWQQTVTGGISDADFNSDGKVDVTDLNEIGRNWQTWRDGMPAAVPEPSSFVLALGALLLLITRRR